MAFLWNWWKIKNISRSCKSKSYFMTLLVQHNKLHFLLYAPSLQEVVRVSFQQSALFNEHF